MVVVSRLVARFTFLVRRKICASETLTFHILNVKSNYINDIHILTWHQLQHQTNMNPWPHHLNQNPTNWLLQSNPWTRYKSYTDLLEMEKSEPEAVAAKTELIRHEKVISLARETKDWLSLAAIRLRQGYGRRGTKQ